MAQTSSLNCLSCRNPYQTPLSLNPSPLFTEKPFFFTEKCFVGSPAQKSAPINFWTWTWLKHFQKFPSDFCRSLLLRILAATLPEKQGKSQKLGCRKWGFKRWGFKEIRGYLRKKAIFLRFLDFPGALQALRKRAKKAEKGRKRPISADFREGRPDTP